MAILTKAAGGLGMPAEWYLSQQLTQDKEGSAAEKVSK